MTRIRVNTDILKKEAQNLVNVGAETKSVGSGLLSATQGAPSYGGQFGPIVQSIGAEAYGQARGASGELNSLGGKLGSTAGAFEAADLAANEIYRAIDGTIRDLGETSIGIGDRLRNQVAPYLRLGGIAFDFAFDGDFLWGKSPAAIGLDIFSIGLVWKNVSVQLPKIAKYAGQMNIFGPDRIVEDWLGIAGRHMKAGTLAKHMAGWRHGMSIRQTITGNLKDSFTNWKGVGGALKIGGVMANLADNWVGHRDEGAGKVVASTVVDTAFSLAIDATAGAGGAYVGAAIGTAICPGVGTVIGGVVGRIAANWAADAATQGVRDSISDALAPGVQAAWDGAGEVVAAGADVA